MVHFGLSGVICNINGDGTGRLSSEFEAESSVIGWSMDLSVVVIHKMM